MNSSPRPIRIATRGSALALAQANLVLDRCRAVLPGVAFEIQVVKTTGDKLQSASLADPALAKGLFTKELELALLQGTADLAVHSLKDLPTDLPAGLKLGGVLERGDVRDVLIYRDIEYLACLPGAARPDHLGRRGFKAAVSIRALPYAATIGTSSTRRGAQMLEQRSDLKIVPIRGNIGTRLQKLAEQADLDAIVLAVAGLERVQCRVSPGCQLLGEGLPPGLAATRLSVGEMLPCVGQAAIAIETRSDDKATADLCAKLNHAETYACVTAERAFLAAMGGGCHLALAAYATIEREQIQLRALSFLGGAAQRAEAQGGLQESFALGQRLAAQFTLRS